MTETRDKKEEQCRLVGKDLTEKPASSACLDTFLGGRCDAGDKVPFRGPRLLEV